MRIVSMGAPDFAVPALKSLVYNQREVAAVYTQPDRPAGRGRALTSSPVKQAALELGLPVVQPQNLKGAETANALAALKPDVIVVAAYGEILPKQVLDIPKFGCVNIHPSLLPRFRGASPVPAAILAGDRFAGISIMLMDEGLDTGPILAQAQVSISAYDTTGTLTDKLAVAAANVLLDVLPRWVAGEIKPRPQEDALSSYTNPLTKADGEINWHLPAADIWRRVRAFQPWPGAFTTWQGKRLEIIDAEPIPQENPAAPGSIVALGKGIGIGTGEGVLRIDKVQYEGKKAMTAAEFLRGQPKLVGGSLLP